MKSILVSVILLIQSSHAIQHLRFIDILNSKKESEDWLSGKNILREDPSIQELFIEQKLDHFRGEDLRIFRQRYFYSDRYVRENQSQIAFLCVGGEGPSLTKRVLIDSVHCTGDMLELAGILYDQGRSIHLYALEHRYYGRSYPEFTDCQNRTMSPVTNNNLVYLSSRQALSDLAHFVTVQSALINQPTWITFGGSYPGMMAAWARLRFPHLIHAAISSSAPLQVTLDFNAYKSHIAFDLANPQIGGSDVCLDIVQSGHAELADAIQDVPVIIAELFNVCDVHALEISANADLFLGDSVISIDVQSNDPSCAESLCNVESLCTELIAQKKRFGSNVRALAAVARQQQKECVEVDWNATLQYLADPIKARKGGLRSWLWQTCSEVGYYQTCELDSTCPFGRGYHRLSEDMEICEYAFNMDRQQVARNVQETLEYYGGWKIAATRILSVNGDIDPWTELALPASDDTDLPSFVVPGASHHFWTHPVKSTDSKEIIKARERVYRVVMQWLNIDNDVAAID